MGGEETGGRGEGGEWVRVVSRRGSRRKKRRGGMSGKRRGGWRKKRCIAFT